MQKKINGAMLKNMILTASKLLDLNRPTIDSLNVFPVPDGDTGTNMSLTLQSAVKELNNIKTNSIYDIADAVGRGALRGARGNSGVILSQVLRGFCNTIRDAHDFIDTKLFTKALFVGAQVAYNAVSKPKEGTMLTVARMVAEHAQNIESKNRDFETYFPEILKKGNEAVELTPELLPVLKKAGVVDAGGKGLMCLYEGMYKALIGEDVGGAVAVINENKQDNNNFEHADILNLGVIEFAYCTEFFIINIKKKTTLADIDRLREKLMTIGDCVIVIGDLELVKVHVHTNRPGVALSNALELGELDKVKIENMLEQNRELRKKYEAEKKEMGMLAVSAGKGNAAIFKDILVDGIIEGGQSMNPSASDIADAVMRINADNVFVFPNNKNIILAAEQAKSLVENRKIHVIPTKNIPQGFAAALAFNPEASVEVNKANMVHSLDNVVVGQITHAVRTTTVDGFDLKEGDIIGLDNKKILAKGDGINQVTLDLIASLKSSTDEVITLYYGEDVEEAQAEELQAMVAEAYPNCDVELQYGGQPIYYYFISLE
ncbi:MAG: DAK2 domain-containing protein [Firmicutes bacterium]|jgi:DAK2 domain fusion protein yloV|nr:DAK2 domain-containing protein [Bacillota bacterium]